MSARKRFNQDKMDTRSLLSGKRPVFTDKLYVFDLVFFTLTSDVQHKRTDVLFRLYPDIKECYGRYLELVQIFGMTVPPRIAGIDTKKEASEIQKPLSGDRRSRTDDPLLAKQML